MQLKYDKQIIFHDIQIQMDTKKQNAHTHTKTNMHIHIHMQKHTQQLSIQDDHTE